MSLPWFAFDADAYTGDTAHLTCEEHGAYLLLMLAYYRSEKPLPATDRALASICKLTPERWSECRPAVAPFFIEADGVWRHERCEAEIAKRKAEYEKHVARAKAGANARWSAEAASRRHAVTKKDQPAMPEASLRSADIEIESNSLSADLEVEKKQSGDIDLSLPGFLKRDQAHDEPPPPVEKKPLTAIDRGYQPPEAIRIECLKDADASTFFLEVQKFIFHQQERGGLSMDWDASFQIWWTRFIGYKRSKADKPMGKPRVDLNPKPEPENTVNWDWHLSRWLKNESTWRRATAGPEPGQPGCRVPPEMLEKHGIDPATGRRKLKEET